MYVSVSAYLYVCTCVYTYCIYELLTLTSVYVSVSNLYMCVLVCGSVCVSVCPCVCVRMTRGQIRLFLIFCHSLLTVSFLPLDSFIVTVVVGRRRRHHHRRWWRAVAVRGVVPSPFPIYLVHSSPYRGKCYRRILSHI